MSDPLVSILIPAYNGERFLRAAIRSAVDQSHRNVEIVIADDGSRDRTPEIIATAAAADERIRAIRHETNVGAYENLRGLLDEARGEYVKFLLHDDVLATDCVRELVRGLQNAPDASMAFSHRALINEDGRPVPGHEFPVLRKAAGLIDGRELGDAVLESCTNVIGEFSTALWRRDALDPDTVWQTDGRRIDVVTDVKVWLQLLARGPAYYSPRTLSRFRHHPGQTTWNPQSLARGEHDWVRMIDWGIRLGFLQEPAQRRRAYARLVQLAAARLASLVAGPDHGPSLESLFLATAALVELGTDAPVAGADTPLWARAHQPELLGRFTQHLEVWGRTYPVAVAAPALDAGEMSATLAALRDVAGAGMAAKLLIAVPHDVLQEALPLIEGALAEGADIDVEVVPTDEPSTLVGGPWLAVAPRGRRWHADLASAVWTVDAAAVVPSTRSVRSD